MSAALALPALSPPAATALALQAALLDCGTLDEACRVAVRELARRLGFDRVSMALVQQDRGGLRLAAVSDGSDPRAATPTRALLLAALGETLDQRTSVRWPEPPDQTSTPCITRAHRALLRSRGDVAVGVPLVVGEAVLGVLCCERLGGVPLETDEFETLERLAGFMAPLLSLLRDRERPWHQILRNRWTVATAPWRRGGRVVLVVALGAALVWPTTLHLGGQARLEGAVQRVLSVPADGFVQQVHARPVTACARARCWWSWPTRICSSNASAGRASSPSTGTPGPPPTPGPTAHSWSRTRAVRTKPRRSSTSWRHVCSGDGCWPPSMHWWCRAI
jgi:hypothetical protein